MNSPAHSSDTIIREARQSLDRQRALVGNRSIGRASARMKARHLLGKLRNIAIAVTAVFVGASIAGIMAGGLGFAGLMATFLLGAAAVVFFARYPRLRIPARADLQTENVAQLVGQTELWLEAQNRALPPPAAKLVGQIGLQLDALQVQLQEVDQAHPVAAQIRKLVGEDLPEMMDGFRRIPEHLRYEERAGSTPNRQLQDGLQLISTEIDSVTRQLAAGALDDLAIRTRYLDYKYGEGEHVSPGGN